MLVKRVLSIILLVILAFNWLGYDLVVGLMNAHADQIAQANIEDGNFDSQQLIEIKVDLELPYSTDWTAFEKTKGTISYQGMVYNFVERKYESGKMIYRCLPNRRGTELQNARDYFYSLAYDMEKQENKKDSAPKQVTAKKINIDITFDELKSFRTHSSEESSLYNAHVTKACLNGFGFIPTQPPEA